MNYRNLAVVLFILLLPLPSFAQTVNDYLLSAKDKINRKDYPEAIKDFTLAIELDTTDNRTYYMLRALVKYEFEDFLGAIKDFDGPKTPKPHELKL